MVFDDAERFCQLLKLSRKRMFDSTIIMQDKGVVAMPGKEKSDRLPSSFEQNAYPPPGQTIIA